MNGSSVGTAPESASRPIRQADYARRCNVNPSTVTRWIQSGRIPVRADGLIDPEEADRVRLLTESPMPHHQARKAQIEAERAAAVVKDYLTTAPQAQEERMDAEELSRRLKLETYRLQKAKADQANLELDRSAALLVERAEVEYLLADLAATLQSKIGSIPALLAPGLSAHRGDVGAITRELEGFARDLLTELSAHLERQAEAHLAPVKVE